MLFLDHWGRDWVDTGQVETEKEALEIEAEDVIDHIWWGWGSYVSIGWGGSCSYRPVYGIEELNSESVIDDVVPGWLVDPQQLREAIVVIVQDMVDLVEDAADIADKDEQDEESIDHVVEDVEGGADNIVLKPVMKHLDFIDLGQIDQLEEASEEGVLGLK